MRVGVIGVGRMGAVHARVCAEHPEVDRLLLCDNDPDRARAVAEPFHAEVVPTVGRLFEKADAVLIVTRTDTHAELVEAAVEHALPVFCEKPVALDLATTRRVAAVVASRGGRVQVGFQRRFDPGYVAARETVRAGRLGVLYLVRTNSHDHEPVTAKFVATSGGIFRDFLLHDFDLVRYVTGEEVVAVFADGACLVADHFAEHGDVDVATAVLRLASGAQVVVSGTRHNARGHDVRMELFGSQDNVTVGQDERSPLRPVDGTEPDHPYDDFIDRFAGAYRREIDAFVSFAAGRGGSPCTVDDATEALRIAVACDRSRAENRPVRLEEVA